MTDAGVRCTHNDDDVDDDDCDDGGDGGVVGWLQVNGCRVCHPLGSGEVMISSCLPAAHSCSKPNTTITNL